MRSSLNSKTIVSKTVFVGASPTSSGVMKLYSKLPKTYELTAFDYLFCF